VWTVHLVSAKPRRDVNHKVDHPHQGIGSMLHHETPSIISRQPATTCGFFTSFQCCSGWGAAPPWQPRAFCNLASQLNVPDSTTFHTLLNRYISDKLQWSTTFSVVVDVPGGHSVHMH
jgi:hypothetical protein